MIPLQPLSCDRRNREHLLSLVADCRPNRLMVDESPSDDNSVAILHPTTMEALGLFRWVQFPNVLLTFRGDTVIGTISPYTLD